MGLVTCPDCSSQISAVAVSCPKCGRPMAASPAPTRAFVEVTVLVARPSMYRSDPIRFYLFLVLSLCVIGLIFFLFWWLASRSKSLTITSMRSIYQEGIFSKRTSEVRHVDVRNIVVHQTFLQRMYGSGTLAISSAGQGGFEISISGIEDPARVKETIDRLRQWAGR